MINHRSKDEEYDDDYDGDDPLQQRQRFRLSGIAQIGDWENQGFVVPWDRNAAVVGGPKRQKRIATVQPVTLPELLDETDNGSKLTGVPLNSRCWTLIQRVVGSEEAEQHLKCLLRVLQLRQLDDPLLGGTTRVQRASLASAIVASIVAGSEAGLTNRSPTSTT
ncbi:hypothetical protein VTN96DRAFT_1489 [Rasamsonia emersonii]